MKKIVVLILFFIFFTIFQTNAAALNESEIAGEAGVNEVSFSEYITADEKSNGKNINMMEKIFAILKGSIRGIFENVMLVFYAILCVTVLASIFTALRQTSSSVLSVPLEYISILALSGTVFWSLKNVFTVASESLSRLHVLMTSLLPVTASLYTLSGSAAAGAAGSASLLFFLTVIEGISSNMLFPLLEVGFTVSLVSALPGSLNLQSLGTLVKNALTSILAFVFTIFGVVMYFQTTLAASADNYIFRSVRFASGVFVPIIGNMVGDAARMVMASVETVKSAVGIMGIITVLSLILPAILYIVVYKAVILVNAIIARMLGCERESRLLYDINSIMSVLMSLMIGTGVIFIIAMAMFIKAGVTL